MTRVIVCGGRNLNDREFVFKMLDELNVNYNFTTIITGGAAGADYLAHAWASHKRLDVEVFPADWEQLGRAAGMIRNKQMLQYAKPNLVIAFPGGKGTENMIKISKKAEIPVIEVAYSTPEESNG